MKLNIIRKVFALVLSLCISCGIMNICVQTYAATDADDSYYVSYDPEYYHKVVATRYKRYCYCQYGSMWSNLDKGDRLGSFTVRMYYLEPLKKADGKNYYAIAGCQVSMDPEDVRGYVTGMSQYALFGINTINEDSRVCSPNVDMLAIQKSTTNSSTNNFTAGAGITFDAQNKIWKPSASINIGRTWATSTTYTYNMTNVNLIPKEKNGDYATWAYDYISRNKDRTWNQYLMSSSKVAGQVVYRIGTTASNSSNRYNYIPSGIKYDVRFGAGNANSGAVANRLGGSTNRDMSVYKGTIPFRY